MIATAKENIINTDDDKTTKLQIKNYYEIIISGRATILTAENNIKQLPINEAIEETNDFCSNTRCGLEKNPAYNGKKLIKKIDDMFFTICDSKENTKIIEEECKKILGDLILEIKKLRKTNENISNIPKKIEHAINESINNLFKICNQSASTLLKLKELICTAIKETEKVK